MSLLYQRNFILENILKEPGSALFYNPSVHKAQNLSYYFHQPEIILSASNRSSINSVLSKTETLISKGLKGFILADYETGYKIIDKLNRYSPDENSILVKVFLYKKANVHPVKQGDLNIYDLDHQKKYSVNSFKLNTSKKEYTAAVKKIRRYIKAGDTYQVNYTVKGKFKFKGDPLSLFGSLLFNQSAPYSAFINDDENYIISLSPELFFQVEGDKIITRPMKGTIKRGILQSDDLSQSEFLINSEKERSENLMIVDLLRNDLGRICKYGSVKTRKMFTSEKYETLFQMISEVRGELRKGIKLNEIFNAIFPCGSVTGAPKISTMEIINSLEKEKRGIYTGSIGLLTGKKKIFNVAIRTLKIEKKTGKGEIGLGSGIVWESQPAKEYEEVLLKSRFLTKPDPYFELFETMLLSDTNILFFDEHLARLEYSASFFLFRMEKEKIKKQVMRDIKKYSEGKFRVRLFLAKGGKSKITIEPFEPFTGEAKVILSKQKNDPLNKFLYHKTTHRDIYNSEYKKFFQKGFFDVIFLNNKNELCEGAVSNIFIRKGKNWYTPETGCGLLPGIFRKFLLDNMQNVSEKIIHKEELFSCDEMILVNSLRGGTGIKSLKIDNKFITW